MNSSLKLKENELNTIKIEFDNTNSALNKKENEYNILKSKQNNNKDL